MPLEAQTRAREESVSYRSLTVFVSSDETPDELYVDDRCRCARKREGSPRSSLPYLHIPGNTWAEHCLQSDLASSHKSTNIVDNKREETNGQCRKCECLVRTRIRTTVGRC